MHYNRPAEYFEEALVIGNGTMGAIVYGGTERDVISLNDLTLWTGEPDRKVTSPDAYKAIPEIRRLLDAGDYRGADREQRKVQGHYSENYQPLGCLTVTYLDVPAQISAYSRSLDIANAVAETRYLRDGQPFHAIILLRRPTRSLCCASGRKARRASGHCCRSTRSCLTLHRPMEMRSRPKAMLLTILIPCILAR